MSNEVEEKKGKKRGFARIQFLAVEPEARKLIEAGHTLKSAHEELRDSGAITMGYSIFRKYILEGVPPITDKLVLHRKCHHASSDLSSSRTIGASNLPTPSEERVLGVVETSAFKQKISKEEKEKLI